MGSDNRQEKEKSTKGDIEENIRQGSSLCRCHMEWMCYCRCRPVSMDRDAYCCPMRQAAREELRPKTETICMYVRSYHLTNNDEIWHSNLFVKGRVVKGCLVPMKLGPVPKFMGHYKYAVWLRATKFGIVIHTGTGIGPMFLLVISDVVWDRRS